MNEEILLYIESEEGTVGATMPLRYAFEDGTTHQVPQPMHELDSVEVMLYRPVRDARYVLRIGGKEFAPTTLLSNGLGWESQKYLANHRGWVSIQVLREHDGETAVTEVEIACLPSKITEDQYHQMVEEIERVSRTFILEVVGARMEVGWRGRTVTTDFAGMEEHEAIRTVVERIRPDLDRLQEEQLLHLKVVRRRAPCWGYEDLDERAIMDFAAAGVHPHDASNRPVLCNVRQRVLTTELHETRQIARFLHWLRARLNFIAHMAEAQIEQIDEDRWWRDNAPRGQTSIWESEDMPRRRELESTMESCKALRRTIDRDVQELPFLSADSGPMDLRPTSIFLRHPIYSRLYRTILSFLRTHGAIFDRADFETQARVKGTDRLYEYWVYLNMVRYLQEWAGLPVEEYGELYEHSPKFGAYTLSIERSYVTFRVGEGRTLRLYYTPLIFRREEAIRRGDHFYRTGDGLPYSPDFLIEVRHGEALEMGIILDAKYMREVSRELEDLQKYLPAIRDTRTGDPFARMLWIVYVGDLNARENEPTCRVEIRTHRPIFVRNRVGRIDVHDSTARIIGSLRYAPRPWGGPDSSLEQLDAFFRPLLAELGVEAGARDPVATFA